MLFKCEKCRFFSFPEGDEDGFVSFGCNNQNVIVVDLNFVRKYKCKHSRKIKHNQLVEQCRKELREISTFSYYNRDKPHVRNRKLSKWRINFISHSIAHYLDLRDYLFSNFKRKTCSYACMQGSYMDYRADCSICIDNKDLDELKRAKRSYIPKFREISEVKT